MKKSRATFVSLLVVALLFAAFTSFSDAQEKSEPRSGATEFVFPSDEQLVELSKQRAAAIEQARDAQASNRAADFNTYQLGTADDLRTTMQLRLYWASQRDMSSLAKANSTLLPDAEALQFALKSDVDSETVAALLTMYKRFSPEDANDEEAWAQMIGFRLNQKDIRVYAATTEEIAAQSTESAKLFPGGAVKAARTILKPEATFFRVEFVEPGEELGMSYHLLYWDGATWRMLGPVWRASRVERAPVEKATEPE